MVGAVIAPSTPHRHAWEVLLSVALMVAGFIGLLVITAEAINMLFSAASCSLGCNYYEYTLGWVLTMIGPSFAFLPALGVTVALILRERTSFWVPLVGFGFALLLQWAGTTLMMANTSQTYGFPS